VSTNDVVVSSFSKAIGCSVTMMACNFRGRIADVGNDHVGNYEDLVCYTPEDYGTPELIRASVEGGTFKRAGGGRMPTNLEHFQGGFYGVVTTGGSFIWGGGGG
jgi:hypothetical protein